MEVGDIVLYNEKRWKVVSHSAAFRTNVLSGFDGQKVEVPDDLDRTLEDSPPDIQGVKVLFNPAKTWPMAAAAVRPLAGPVTGIFRGSVSLAPLVDWVPSDFLRPGGAIFFNPRLRLRTGEVLAVVYKDGSRNRVTITPAFGTLQKRRHRHENPIKPKGPQTSFDRLMSEDPFEDM